jgi:hypothetical protein
MAMGRPLSRVQRQLTGSQPLARGIPLPRRYKGVGLNSTMTSET